MPMEGDFLQSIKVAGYAIEAFGVLVMVIGMAIATKEFLTAHKQQGMGEAYKSYYRNLGRSIILGLEFLIAGDIVRTVIVAESLQNIGILAIIVLIRTFLTMTLHLEIEGQWPWQKSASRQGSNPEVEL